MTVRTNLVPNPSFEVDTTDWTAGSNTTIARSTAQSFNGSASLAMTASTVGGISAQTSMSSPMPITPGATYAFRAQMRAGSLSAESRLMRLWVYWLSAPNTLWDMATVQAASVNSSGWTLLSGTSVAPLDANYMAVYIAGSSGTAGDVIYIDSVLAEEASSVGTYFDGSLTDTSEWDYAWTGTAHNSPSTATSIPAEGSVSGNFSFSASASGERSSLGSAAGGFTFSGGASGEAPPNTGSASGSFAFTGTAIGDQPPLDGSASGAFDFTGSAAGSRSSSGTAAGAYDEAGSATGSTPTWAPRNLQAVAVSGSQIDLTWDALGYATAYDIERDGVVIATDVATTSYSDTGLDGSTEYTYRVRGVYA